MMFERKDKRILYQLIDIYLSGKIDARIFCNGFYYSYDIEIDSITLDDFEKVAFSELSYVLDRFSEFSDDHLKYPNVFFAEEYLNKKVIEIKNELQKHYLIE